MHNISNFRAQQEVLEMYNFSGYEIILALAIMIIAGHTFGKLAEKIKLPEVTGFIFAGVILNLIFGRLLGFADEVHTLVGNLEVVSTIALGFLSFTLGTKLFLPKVKKHYKVVLTVLTIQLILVVAFSIILFYLFFPLWIAVLIAGISAATASAPVMEIAKKFQAKGPLTSTLMPLIGLDNIMGTIVFILSTIVAFHLKSEQALTFSSFLEPLQGIGLSLLIGLILGAILVFLERKILCKYCGEEKYESYLVITVGIVLLTVLAAQVLGTHIGLYISPFVAPLILGCVFTNSLNKQEYQFESHIINGFTPPLITAFFVIAGAELDITRIFEFGGYALLYVIAHASGKYLGAWLGTRAVRSTDPRVKKYLPTATLTQGGFEIFFAASLVGMEFIEDDNAILIKSIVLTAVLIFELFAPMLLTKSIFEAGEGIVPIDDDVCEIDITQAPDQPSVK